MPKRPACGARVFAIYKAIRALANNELHHLWEILKHQYPADISGACPPALQEWELSQNGYTASESRLLAFLLQNGESNEREVIKAMWPGQLNRATEHTLRQRLRKLEQRVRDKQLRFVSCWQLRRTKLRKLRLVHFKA